MAPNDFAIAKKFDGDKPLALPPRAAARALGVSERTLWTYTRSRGVPHVRLGRRILYPVHELAAWLSRQTVTVAAPDASG